MAVEVDGNQGNIDCTPVVMVVNKLRPARPAATDQGQFCSWLLYVRKRRAVVDSQWTSTWCG
jgi:hypothetical protein